MAQILVVDDDPAVRGAIRSILEPEGHAVREAANGHEAEAADTEAAADVVILDIHMPERDGIETLRAFRANRRRAKILATNGGCAICGVDYLHVAQRLGADATLHKPFAPDDLLRALLPLLPNADAA